MNLNQEELAKEQNQTKINSAAGTAKAAAPKVKIMKPPKKNRKPIAPPSASANVAKTTECPNITEGETT